MKQRYIKQPRTRKAAPPPDIIRQMLDHYGYREDMLPERKQEIRFMAADMIEDTYFRMMGQAPDCIRRNMSIHSVIDKATTLLNGDGIIPAGSTAAPTQAERDFWTRRFPGTQYTPATNDKPRR